MSVSFEQDGEWVLEVMAEPEFILHSDLLLKEKIDPQTVTKGWKDIKIDLTKYAGLDVEIQINQHAKEIQRSNAYWSHIEVISE